MDGLPGKPVAVRVSPEGDVAVCIVVGSPFEEPVERWLVFGTNANGSATVVSLEPGQVEGWREIDL